MKATELIGKNAIRTAPTKGIGDRSYSDEPLYIINATDTNIAYRHAGELYKKIFGDKIYILGSDFADDNWVDYDKLINPASTTIEPQPFDWQAFKSGKFAVHCDTEEKAKAFLKECDEHGIKWSSGGSTLSKTEWESYKSDTLYGITKYGSGGLSFGTSFGFDDRPAIDYVQASPAVREVHRPAKVGEWIKLVNRRMPYDFDKDGEVLLVCEASRDYVSAKSNNKARISASHPDGEWKYTHDEYVVLENHQPEDKSEKSKTLADYSTDELLTEIKRRADK